MNATNLTWWFWRRILIWLWNDCNWSLYCCGTWPGIPEISAILFFSVDNLVFLIQHAQFGRFWILNILFPHLTLLSVSKDKSWSLKVLRCSPLALRQPPWVCNIYFLSGPSAAEGEMSRGIPAHTDWLSVSCSHYYFIITKLKLRWRS